MSDIESKWQGFEALAQKLDVYYKHVAEVKKQWPEEVTKWQTEDMHRRYPNTASDEADNTVTTETDVWPHSRLEIGPGAAKRVAVKRGPRQARPKGAGKSISNRPILREELLQKLKDRMMALGREAIKWP
jgi:hypothetical protein